MALMLGAGLSGWPTDPREAELRASILRRMVDHLSDDQWLYAADAAARTQQWFPVPATILDFAEDYVPPYKALPPARDEATRERDREAAKRGVELIREEMRRRGIDPGPAVKEMP